MRRIYAWVGNDLEGSEGIIMVPHPVFGAPLPMVATDVEIMRIGKRLLPEAAIARGSTLYLVSYMQNLVVDTLKM